MPTDQNLSIVATFVVAMAGLFRYGMMQHRRLADQFVTFLENSLQKRENMNEKLTNSLESLSQNVGENSVLLSRIASTLKVV